MSSIIKETEYDERDAKFIKIKEKFIQAIKKNFECEGENYDQVIKYVFEEVFKNKMEKENCIVEFKSIFDDRTEEYVDILFQLANKILREDDNAKDNDDPANDNFDDKHKNYSKRNDGNYPQYGNRRDRKGSREYYQGGRGGDKFFRGGANRKGNFGRGGNRFLVGNKEVKLHNNQRKISRSRSRENSEGEMNPDNSGRYQKTYAEDYQEYPNQGFQGRGYYNQPQTRMFPPQPPMIRGVPFYPGMMGFMGLQRPPFIGKPPFSKTTFKKAQPQQNQEQPAQPNAQQNAANEQNPNANAPEEVNNPDAQPNQQPQAAPVQPQVQAQSSQEGEKNPADSQGDKANSESVKKKTRCKNWPHCKDPNCQYAHPTETCPHFPNCMFGDKCCYIHPNIPCKYGYYCTRIGCSYSHPAGFNPGMGFYPNLVKSIPTFKGKKKFPGKAHPGEGQGGNEGAPAENENPADVQGSAEKVDAPANNLNNGE